MRTPSFAILLTALFCFSMHTRAQTALYSVPEVNWEPYWIVEDGRGHGILGKLMQHLASQADLELEASPPYPVKRVQKMFSNAKLTVECCMNRSWRPAEDSHGESLWTEPVMTTHEVLVFPKGQTFNASSSQDLAGKQVATILGYGYANDDLYTRNDVLTNIAQLKLVAARRVDVGIVDMHELQYLLSTHETAQTLAGQTNMGPKIGSSELRMRVHSARPDLLEKLNQQIKRIKSDGTLSRISSLYLEAP